MTRYRPAAVVAMLAALVLSAAAAARAQVLDQVPADALVVVKIKNIGDVSKKAADFMAALGVAEMQPGLADPLGTAEQELGIKQGLDRAGDFAFVYLDPKVADGDDDKSMLLLVPVSDYAAFVGNFAGAEADGAVTTFTPEGGEEMYAANWGKYAALSPTKAIVANAPEKGLKLSGLAAKEADTRDALVWANIPALKEMAQPQLEEARAEMAQEFQNQDLGKFGKVAEAWGNHSLNMAEAFLRDAQAVTLSLNLSDDGISSTFAADFTPDSYMGKLAKELKNSDAELVTGLPEREYFAFGGATFDPEVAGRIVSDLVGPVQKELAAVGDEGKTFADALDALKTAAGSMQGASFGYAVPTGAVGQESLIQSITVFQGDSKAFHSATKELAKGITQMLLSVPPGGAVKPAIEMKPESETVGGVALDRYTFDLGLDPNDPQTPQAQMVMNSIFGPNGFGGVMGPIDDDTYITIQGGSDKLLEDAVAAAKAGEGAKLTDAEGVKMVSGQLPKSRILVEYIALDNIMRTSVKYASAFMPGLKMQLPDDLPPIGVAVASEGTAVRVDGFVPTTLVQSIVAAGMQTYMQLQGGGGGGGPDGL